MEEDQRKKERNEGGPARVGGEAGKKSKDRVMHWKKKKMWEEPEEEENGGGKIRKRRK